MKEHEIALSRDVDLDYEYLHIIVKSVIKAFETDSTFPVRVKVVMPSASFYTHLSD